MNAIIALNGQQMAEQQHTLVQWADQRIEAIDVEIADAMSVAEALQRARMPHGRANAGVNAAKRRRVFYEKVKAALELGYQIIPPFDLQVFAIRTDRESPYNRSTNRWEDQQGPRILPQGSGHYVDPIPPRLVADSRSEPDGKGGSREITEYFNGAYQPVEIPVRALKPHVIDAVGAALRAKVFDSLGIAPAYRSVDPIIGGRILHPNGRQAVTFMVAWWLDKADL